MKVNLFQKMRLLLLSIIVSCVLCKKSSDTDKPDWAKKNIRDYR